MTPASRLLVSVRSPAEAEAALAGGADLIDIKEPARGSLGRADDAVIAAIFDAVQGRRPVSAALGDLQAPSHPLTIRPLAYVKWGLAGLGDQPWRPLLARAVEQQRQALPACQPVVVAYADWRRAGAPNLGQVVEFAAEHSLPVLLDTFRKDGKNLLQWLTVETIVAFCKACRAAGLPVALAGSLGLEEIEPLREARPTWFAVRGAVCTGMDRAASIDPGRVRLFARCLRMVYSAAAIT